MPSANSNWITLSNRFVLSPSPFILTLPYSPVTDDVRLPCMIDSFISFIILPFYHFSYTYTYIGQDSIKPLLYYYYPSYNNEMLSSAAFPTCSVTRWGAIPG